MMEKVTFKIVPFYASLLTLYYLLLTYRAIKVRAKYRVPLGDGVLEYISGVERQRSESSSADSYVTQILDNPLSERTMDYKQFRHFQRNNRAHANFSENVPLTLLLLFFIEVNNYISPLWLHVACGALLAGRIIHGDLAFNFATNDIAVNVWRRLGVSLNLVVLVFAAIVNVCNLLMS